MANISIQNLTKRFDGQPVLKALSLTVPEGSFFTLLGPSGCGKTTLLRCIAGFNDPDEGRIFFDNDDITQVPAHLRNIGMVFQDYALFPDKTIFDNVAYGLRARKVAKDELNERSLQALDLVGLKHLDKRLPAQLSGGQRQRVALARALVIKPRVLLMDEPLSNLDAKLRLTMRDVILDLQKQFGITTVFVTHDQEEALAMSDQIALMQSGKVAQIGAPSYLYDEPQSTYVADFIGSANLVPVKVVETGRVEIAGVKIVADTRLAVSGAELHLVLRPETLTLHATPTETKNCLPVDIKSRQYLGAKNSYRVVLEGGSTLNVDQMGSAQFAVNDRVFLSVPEHSRVVPA